MTYYTVNINFHNFIYTRGLTNTKYGTDYYCGGAFLNYILLCSVIKMTR